MSIEKIEKHEALGYRILVKVDEVEEVKALKNSSLVIVKSDRLIDNESAAVDTGIVVDIGRNAFKGYVDPTPWVEIGDRVSFLRHAGAIRKVNGQDYRILNDNDLLTRITTEEVVVETQTEKGAA